MDSFMENRICAAIAVSPFFNADWYLEHNPDVALSGMDPVQHYVRHGEAEGRNPGSGFDLRCHWHRPGSSGNLLYDHIMWERRPPDKEKIVPIVFAVNDKYVPYLSVAIASLAYTANPERDYVVYIFYNQLSPQNIATLKSQATPNVWIEPVNVSAEVREIIEKAHISAHASHETYFRILIPQMLPQYDKCLYLDCDLVINQDISQLYDFDISDYFLGAIEENWEAPGFQEQKRQFTPYVVNYFNGGVLLINNSKFNKYNMFDAFMQHIYSGVKYPTWDQDILNILCSGKTRLLPMTWNCMWHLFVQQGFKYSSRKVFQEFADCAINPALVHYNAPEKPWQMDDGHFASMFWRHAVRSPYYEQIKNATPYNVDETLTRAKGNYIEANSHIVGTANSATIVFSTNDAYAPYLSVAIASVICHASQDNFYEIYILTDKIDHKTKKMLESQAVANVKIYVLDVSEMVRDIVANASVCSHFSHEMYFRLLIPILFPNHSRIIYLDCDIVTTVDMAKMVALPLENELLAAVNDTWHGDVACKYRQNELRIPSSEYFNSGVLLINCNAWRRENITARCLDLAYREKSYLNPDQDILNVICRGRVKYLHQGWNCMWQYYLKSGFQYSTPQGIIEFARHFKNAEIIHFNSNLKPWNTDDGLFAARFWRYAHLSPYFERLKLECPYRLNDILAKIEADI